MDLGFEKDAGGGKNTVLHDLHKGEDIRGTGDLINRDDISMEVCYVGATDAQAFATGLIQQSPGGFAGWIFKD